jgi:hypothetical protein
MIDRSCFRLRALSVDRGRYFRYSVYLQLDEYGGDCGKQRNQTTHDCRASPERIPPPLRLHLVTLFEQLLGLGVQLANLGQDFLFHERLQLVLLILVNASAISGTAPASQECLGP